MRFPLLTSHLLPAWMLAVFAAVLLLFALVGIIGFVTQLELAALGYLAFTGLMVWFVFRAATGLRDPSQNFVELGQEGMGVSLFRPFLPVLPGLTGPVTFDVLYSEIESVTETTRRFPHGQLAWPYPVNRDHVDVVLKTRRRTPGGWGASWPWTKVLHLEVEDRQAFVSELRSRIVTSD